MIRRKSLLIGINYTGSSHELHGCHTDVQNVAEFLSYRGYSSDPQSQVILRDDRRGPYYPSGHNILAAMDWLVAEPGTCCFLHYSGHGGQVPDPDGDRESGMDDTIVPVDFETHGQLDSDLLHRHLVSKLPPNSTLFVIFDCCHSGSAIELPFVYRSDDDGNISLMQDVQTGINIFEGVDHLIQGGFSMRNLNEASALFQQSKGFFHGLLHRGDQQPEGLGEENFVEHWERENKMVTMFSGCRDDQTSADANIQGIREGALTWAFLQVMRNVQNPTYVQTLQDTRGLLKQSKYAQIAQLSTGRQFDLEQPLIL